MKPVIERQPVLSEPEPNFLRNSRRHPYRRIYLAAAAFLLLVSTGIFGCIATGTLHSYRLNQADVSIAWWFHAHMTPRFTLAMKVITELAGFWTITVLASLLGLFFILFRRWHKLLLLILIVPGGRLVCFALKTAFQRHRPYFEGLDLTIAGYSFPSDHTMGATLLYGFASLVAFATFRNGSARAASAASAVLLVLLVGLSRIALGAHYLSDVLGAMAAGVAWLITCVTIFHLNSSEKRPRFS